MAAVDAHPSAESATKVSTRLFIGPPVELTNSTCDLVGSCPMCSEVLLRYLGTGPHIRSIATPIRCARRVLSVEKLYLQIAFDPSKCGTCHLERC